MAAAWDEQRAAASAAQEVARAAALGSGDPIEFFRGQQTGYGATAIAPTWLNPGGVPSHVINVPWGETGGPGDPDFQALMQAAAQRMTENMVYDPNLHAASGGGGGYTSQPGARARVAEAIRQANS
jgi:hypothetical protein